MHKDPRRKQIPVEQTGARLGWAAWAVPPPPPPTLNNTSNLKYLFYAWRLHGLGWGGPVPIPRPQA